VNWSRFISIAFSLLFAAVAGWGALFFLELHRELTALRAQEEVNQRKLVTAQAKLAEQEKYLIRLRNDPALVEQVVRKKLGYVRANEFVFRFEETPQP
jgi:cell division protein DivIC